MSWKLIAASRSMHHASSVNSLLTIWCFCFGLLACVSFTHGQEARKDLVKIELRAELIGLTEDGKQVVVRVHEPPGRRVKHFEGFLDFADDQGKFMQDAPMMDITLNPYPMDENPWVIMSTSIKEDSTRFREFVRTRPARFRPRFHARLEFDDAIEAVSRNQFNRVPADDGEMAFEYALKDRKGVVFMGRMIQRWNGTHLIPWLGIRLTHDPATTIRIMTFKLTLPGFGQDNSDEPKLPQWQVHAGIIHDKSTVEENHQGEVKTKTRKINTWSWELGSYVEVAAGESRLPALPTQIPLIVPDIEAHWIPFRAVNGGPEAYVIIFADTPEQIQAVIKTLPMWRGREVNWDNFYKPE